MHTTNMMQEMHTLRAPPLESARRSLPPDWLEPTLWMFTMIAVLTALAVHPALAQDGGAGDGQGGSDGGPAGTGTLPPCPPMEILCDDYAGSGGQGEQQIDCECGDGYWIRNIVSSERSPEVPLHVTTRTTVGATRFLATRAASTETWGASSQVEFQGKSSWWDAGSAATMQDARYRIVYREEWRGDGAPCPRMIRLAAGGGATLHISASAAPRQGCTAATSASVSGFASSRGDASATLGPLDISGSVGYIEASSAWSVDGNFGASELYESPSVEGSLSTSVSWEVQGTGSHSGSATLAVKPDRTYCAFTNKPVTIRAVGNCVVGASGSVDDNGSCSATALANVSVWVF
ncbi:MAG: hypothetical protein O2819_06920 [Planctomycetota bacterium]|nr:hypothetical protein [Planctomycetota bacterium]MDA1105188.1 hypothetical protein [Planctomycetota bacterium]